MIQRVPEPRRPGKNRVHIDLFTAEPGEEARRIEGLGARLLRDFTEDGQRCIVMADPDGNEFCIVEDPGSTS